MADRVTWFELPADDTVRAGKFYNSAFGWQLSDMGGGSVVVQNGPVGENMTPVEPGSINGDISPRSKEFDQPLIVIETEDIQRKLKMVEQAGGSIVLPAVEMAEMGMMWAIVADTEGNKVGVVQSL